MSHSKIFLTFFFPCILLMSQSAGAFILSQSLVGSFICSAGGTYMGNGAMALIYSYMPGCEAMGPYCSQPQATQKIEYFNPQGEMVVKTKQLGFVQIDQENLKEKISFSIKLNQDYNFSASPTTNLLEAKLDLTKSSFEENLSGIQVPDFKTGPYGGWSCKFSGGAFLTSHSREVSDPKDYSPEQLVQILNLTYQKSNLSLLKSVLTYINDSKVDLQKDSTFAWVDDINQYLRIFLKEGRTSSMEVDMIPNVRSVTNEIVSLNIPKQKKINLLDTLSAAGFSYYVNSALSGNSELKKDEALRKQLIGRYCETAKKLYPNISCIGD